MNLMWNFTQPYNRLHRTFYYSLKHWIEIYTETNVRTNEGKKMRLIPHNNTSSIYHLVQFIFHGKLRVKWHEFLLTLLLLLLLLFPLNIDLHIKFTIIHTYLVNFEDICFRCQFICCVRHSCKYGTTNREMKWKIEKPSEGRMRKHERF